jgi:hypothetical protein
MRDDERLNWVVPAAIVVLATGLRLLQLGNEDLWLDEVLQVGYASNSDLVLPKSLSQWLLSLVLHVSDSEFVLRLPSAIFSVGEVGLIYLLALRLFSRRTAAIAALFVALAPLHVWYAQEVRWYSQWSFLTTLTFLFLLQLLDGARLRAWIGYAVASVMNLYTFVLSAIVVVLQGAIAVLMPKPWQPDQRKLLMAIAVVQVAVMAAAGPLILLMLGGADSPTGTPRPTRLVVLPYTFFAYTAGYSVGPSLTELHELPAALTVIRGYPEILAYYLMFGALAVAGFIRLLSHRWPARETVLIWATGMPLALYVISVILGGTYNVRYTLVSLPAVYLLFGVGADAILDRFRWGWLAVVLAVVLFGVSLDNYFTESRYDKEHVTEALQYIHRADPEFQVVVSGQLDVVVEYYSPGVEIGPVGVCNSDHEDSPATIEALGEESSFWLIVGRAWLGQEEYCRAAIEPEFDIIPEAKFVGLDLYRAVRVP